MPTPGGYPTYAEQKASRRMMWWYEAMADYMIANPTHTVAQIAKAFDRGEATVQLVKNSDSFKTYLRQRRADFVQEHDAAIRAKQLGIVETGMDVMLRILEKKQDTVPLAQLADIIDKGLGRLGYGEQKGGTNVQVNVNNPAPQVVAVGVDDLRAAQQAMRIAQQRQLEAPQIVDVSPNPAGEASPNPSDEERDALPVPGKEAAA